MVQAVVCNMAGCSYRGASGFCNREYVMLNAGGGCTQIYLANGQPRAKQWDLDREIEVIPAEDSFEEAEESDVSNDEAEPQEAEG